MKPVEIRALTVEELNKNAAELKKGIFKLKFSGFTGEEIKPSELKKLKKDIARIKTIIREKQHLEEV